MNARKRSQFRKLFIFAALFFLFMAVTSLFDIFHDKADDLSRNHLYLEIFTLSLSLLGAGFFLNSAIQMLQQNVELSKAIEIAVGEKEAFQKKVEQYAKGLSEAIDAEFDRWGLTETEKEVGLLVLKGLSTKKIAEILGTTDKTTRHHCSSIYKKSNLSGRTELSAYFLEDLLILPQKP